MANPTMLDVAKLNGSDKIVGLIEENLKYAPEAAVFPFRTIQGVSYKTVLRTALPTTGFRNANEGQALTRSEFREELIQTRLFGGPMQIDKAVADADEDGAEAFLTLQASGLMQSALQEIGSQIWYGTANDPKGFPGLKTLTAHGATTLRGDPLSINAGGSAASKASSVYLVKFGPQDITLIGGRSKAWELPEFQIQQAYDSNGAFMAYVTGLTGWIGLQTANPNSVRRIYNLTDDAGKGLTDALLSQALATFPVGQTPDAIFMSRRSRSQLQASRTVVLQGTGVLRPDQPAIAPLPTSFDGIPIYVTESIGDTDAIES